MKAMRIKVEIDGETVADISAEVSDFRLDMSRGLIDGIGAYGAGWIDPSPSGFHTVRIDYLEAAATRPTKG